MVKFLIFVDEADNNTSPLTLQLLCAALCRIVPHYGFCKLLILKQ